MNLLNDKNRVWLTLAGQKMLSRLGLVDGLEARAGSLVPARKLRWAKKSVYPYIENPEACEKLETVCLEQVPSKFCNFLFLDDEAETLLESSDGSGLQSNVRR